MHPGKVLAVSGVAVASIIAIAKFRQMRRNYENSMPDEKTGQTDNKTVSKQTTAQIKSNQSKPESIKIGSELKPVTQKQNKSLTFKTKAPECESSPVDGVTKSQNQTIKPIEEYKHKSQITDKRQRRQLFGKSALSHSLEKGANHKAGPILHGVFGRKTGQSFECNQDTVSEGITYNIEMLSEYSEKQKKYILGTKIEYTDFKKENQRNDFDTSLETTTK